VPRVRLSAGRARRHTRGGALDRVLVASGEAPLLTTLETTRCSACERFFLYTAATADFREMEFSCWPSDVATLEGIDATPLFRDGDEGVYRIGDALVLVGLEYGFVRVRLAAHGVAPIQDALTVFRQAFAPTFLTDEDARIPITFWMMGKFGPEQRLRRIDTATWEQVEGNYPAAVRGALEPLMHGFQPGKDGQLLLWQGPPGTGKTWALRALASEWRSWAEFSYITDPDAFFVEHPSYMVDVLLADTFSAIEPSSGDVYSEVAESKWRVLILEDTGELLSATAKERYGQGLSRLLNVVDGMIGQGLRVLALVTTNDELGELNEAVRRPGRCASQIVFPSFPPDEARAWLAARVVDGNDSFDEITEPMSLAEMYALAGESEPDALTAAAAEPEALVAEVVRVAEQHQDEAIGYGETAFDPETGTVYWIHGDWTDCEKANADFLAIDGVNNVVCDGEAIPDGWPYGLVVYPDPPPKWVTVPPEKQQATLDDLVTFAGSPLV
jgi:hypothetical protein